MKKKLEIIIPSIVIAASIVFIILYALHSPAAQPGEAPLVTVIRPKQPRIQPTLPKFPSTLARQIARSPDVFAYAHGTALADGQIFIGMAARSGNPFVTNQLFVFPYLRDISVFQILSIPVMGDIEAMTYDSKNDKVYFTLSNNGSLSIYGIDPKTHFIYTLMSTTTVDIGLKPAITTDGTNIYGISYTEPSTVFKFELYKNVLATTTTPMGKGHSAASGKNRSATELYFGGGEDDGFEKVSGEDLSVLGSIMLPGCNLTDDMPYQKVTDTYGYVYVGCEKQPYGYRIKTDDLSYVRFSLPGNSYGMFIYGNDLYNAAQDGNFEVFKDMDIDHMQRYSVGGDTQLNELFVTHDLANASSTATTTNIFYTGWWGTKGLFESVI